MLKVPPAQLVEEAEGLVHDLNDAGLDADARVDAVARFLDAILPLDVLIPGPLGQVAECADGPAFAALVRALKNVHFWDEKHRAERQRQREERRKRREIRRPEENHAA